METSREELRRKVYREYTFYSGGNQSVRCPWCNRKLTGGNHLHEWLIKRNAVPVQRQSLIMTPENCILVCGDCHDQFGQTKKFKMRCLAQAVRYLGATRIGTWYYDLSHSELRSLPQGDIFTRGATTSTTTIIRSLGLLVDTLSIAMPEHWQGHAAIGQAILAWRGKTHDNISLGDLNLSQLVKLIEEARWLSYLQGVCQ